ncbi:hypothetical protein [Actinocorallia libanotica]|uniref:Serine esterase DUF676 n=1 Tax=Actinocorallia libanotica TaxID=46162 RepID=A0ABP4CHD7_9ACTN
MNNEQKIASALSATPIALSADPGVKTGQAAPGPDETWQLPGGTAWVYYGQNNQMLTRPVLLADGFNSGPSKLDDLYEGLERKAFPLISSLRRRGRDVVIIGYDDRSASIFTNAQAVTAAVFRAIAERIGSTRLMVGGFSMGGLVTRYALARMEMQRMDHQTGVYFSWDTPHRGAYVPISLQAFAHYIKDLDSAFSDQMNSPAARQMLAWHLEAWDGVPGVDPLRTEFLQQLQQVGGWPRIPRLLGIADGAGDGTGNGIAAGATAVLGTGATISGTDLRTQPKAPDTLAARLRVGGDVEEVHAPDVPPVDGAPGGTMNGFEVLADVLNSLPAEYGMAVDNPIAGHCFVPSISSTAIRDITEKDLYLDIDSLSPDESDLDDFLCASTNGGHTEITEEAAYWLIDRLPD